ncbi:hypothetical protein Tco_1240810 [Tanacetum coccineum]
MAPLPLREQRHRFVRYKGLEYIDSEIADFESRLGRIYTREVYRVHVADFLGMPDLLRDGLTTRMLMEHRDEAGVSVFTSRAWWWMFDIRGPLVHELILEFFSTFRFGQAILDLDTPRSLQFQLARYLRLFAAERKSGEHISRGQFIARLADHFGLLTICVELNDTWAWVAMGPERQPDDVAGAPAEAEDASIIDKGGQADPAPAQPPPPPPAPARTIPQRLGRLEEDVQGMCRDVKDLWRDR